MSFPIPFDVDPNGHEDTQNPQDWEYGDEEYEDEEYD